MTVSERLFDDYCADHRIACDRVPEGVERTPDYEITLERQRVVVEVKEITPNDEELESERLARERGWGNVLSVLPGERVRRKIADCSKQLKGRSKGILPSMLVVFDRGKVAGHVDPYHIRVAMYGLEQIYFVVPRPGHGPMYPSGMGYGPKRTMTPSQSTSISAVGALVMTGPTEVLLRVYHNRFARVPLEPSLLARYGIEQFRLRDEVPGAIADWEAVNP